jgi:hypothetical protein
MRTWILIAAAAIGAPAPATHRLETPKEIVT